MNFVNSRAALYKKILEVIFLGAMPLLASGKTTRGKLYALVENNNVKSNR